jgi:hypothetical protein
METEIEVKVIPLPSFLKCKKKIWPRIPDAAIMRKVAEEFHRADSLGGGLYKVRIDMAGTGKRGGARVILCEMSDNAELLLLSAYPKAKQENLTILQKRQLMTLVGELKETEGNHHGRKHIQRFKVRPRRG